MCDFDDLFDDVDADFTRDPELTSPFTVVAALAVDVDLVDPDDDPADQFHVIDVDDNYTASVW